MQKNETFESLIERYEIAFKECGLSPSSRLDRIGRAVAIIRRHENQGKDTLDGNIIAAYFNELDERYCEGEMTKRSWQRKRREVERFLHFVQTGEIVIVNPLKGSRYTLLPEFERIADEFLSSEEFHPNTRNDARWATHKYFSWLAGQGHEGLCDVGAEHIQNFLLHCAQSLAMGSVHNIKLYLSKLYRHLYELGLSKSSHKALLSFTVDRGTIIQPVLQKNEITALFDSIDRNTSDGKRAYAVMMLGAVLGLRACDIVNMELSDIDWLNGEIKILQAKSAKTVVLPLTTGVGVALQDYILNARPEIESDRVFIRLQKPFKPISSAVTIGEIYGNCCKAAGLPVNRRFHTLRRTLGTSMVTSGAPVAMVAQVLGHTEVASTQKYIALNSAHLKICALSFEGIASTRGGAVK